MADCCAMPHNAAFPKTWDEFRGKKNGNRKYRIQDITEEYYDEVIECMEKCFCVEEPTCKYIGFSEDPDCLTELREVWLNCLKANLSVVCLEVDENGGLTVAGFILLYHTKESDTYSRKPITEKWQKICDVVGYINKKADVFKTLNINNYLGELGLLVLPEFRGEGIGEKLIYTCDKICKAYNYPVTVMVFSSYKSQFLGEKTGFKELFAISYAELRQLDPKKYGIDRIEEHTKDIKCTYRASNYVCN